MPVLCLGEALVDLIRERPDAYAPHFGGAVANVAVVAAQHGAPTRLAGGVGDDEWGAWLRDRLISEDVDVSLFRLLPDHQTPLALVRIEESGEAQFEIYGEIVSTVVSALEDGVEAAVNDSTALFFSSNTLVGDDEREVTMAAREVALESGRPVVFDPNLRLHRWATRARAAAAANACVPGALLVRATAAEATLMTGEEDVERAALALVKARARLVVVTLGSRGAILRGELRADVPGVPADVISTVGAGDVLTGILLAQLALSDFYPPAAAAALPQAVEASARACERWGALE